MIRKTSIMAYNQIREDRLLSQKRLRVYEILFKHGPLTGAQVSEQYKQLYNTSKYSETIRNRLTELVKMNIVDELGITECPISKRKVILYDVNSNLPSKMPARKTRTQKKNDLIDTIEAEQGYIRTPSFSITRKDVIDFLTTIITKVREL